jgi:hypothetical protein
MLLTHPKIVSVQDSLGLSKEINTATRERYFHSGKEEYKLSFATLYLKVETL